MPTYLADSARLEAFWAGSTATGAPWDYALAAATEYLQTQIGRDIVTTTYTNEMYRGDGTAILRLNNWPIQSVTSLTVGGETWTVLGPTYAADSGQTAFVPSTGSWLEARGTKVFTEGSLVVVSYVAGFDTVPDDLQMCCCMIARLLLEERNRLGMTAKSLGPEQINMIARNANDYQFIKDTIDYYARSF